MLVRVALRFAGLIHMLTSPAVSYDWHKGHSFAPPSGSNTNKIFLHSCTDEEVRRRRACSFAAC